MSRIDDENKKQFRQPMKILAGINGRDTRVADNGGKSDSTCCGRLFRRRGAA